MRKVLFFVAVAAFISVGYALGKPARPSLAAPSASTLTGACAKANLKLVHDGQLTLGSDILSYPPWWDGHPKKGTPYKISNPYSGKGFESAVAYEVAKRLGFTRAEVKWTPVLFLKAIAPGPKPFDFYIAQVSATPVRAKAVTFSSSYYEVNQAIVGLKKNAISKVKTVAGLKPFTLGTQVATTSYDYIAKYIKPSKQPKVYRSLDLAVAALKNGQIDGLVVDYPDTGYITGVQVPNSVVVGRLPTKGGQEHFGLVLKKGNTFVSCLDKVLAGMRADGTLKRFQQTWLSGTAPQLK